MESVKQKTYKREVAFSLMAIEVGLILWSAASESTHIQGLAEFLMPFAATRNPFHSLLSGQVQ
jgi:hypothetical protein